MALYSILMLATLWHGTGAGNQATQQTAVVTLQTAPTHYRQLADAYDAAVRAATLSGPQRLSSGQSLELRGAFLAQMRPLVELGYAPAIGWSIAHFVPDPKDPRDPALVLRELYALVLPSECGEAWIFDDEIELLTPLRRDRTVLGAELCSAFASAIFNATPASNTEARARALTLEAEALAPLGCADDAARLAAATIWRRELKQDPHGPLAGICELGLWRLRSIVVGQPLPALRALDVNQNEIDLDDFRGKVVVMVFFSFARTGDPARVAEFARLQDKFHLAPFTVLGVDQDQNETLFRKLSEEVELRFPCIFEGGRNGRIASVLHLDAAPSCLVIDRHGVLRFVDLETAALEAAVLELVAEPIDAGERPSETLRRR